MTAPNAQQRLAQRLASIAAAPPIAVEGRCDRAEPRRSVYRQGRLIVAGGVELNCMIVDTSENGARVELDGAESLPDFVTLKIVMTGASRRARVIWRRGRSAGLSFRYDRQTFGAAR